MMSVTRIQSWLASRTLVLGMLLCLLGAGWCQAAMAAQSALELTPVPMLSHDCCPDPQPLQPDADRVTGGPDCDRCGDDWSSARSLADDQPLTDPGDWLLTSSSWPLARPLVATRPLLHDAFLFRPARPLFLLLGHFLE